MAEPFLEKNVHPTVIVRGYVKALEDAIKIVDDLSFPIDTNDKAQMLKIVNSCIGTKFTNQFGNLMAVGVLNILCLYRQCPAECCNPSLFLLLSAKHAEVLWPCCKLHCHVLYQSSFGTLHLALVVAFSGHHHV